MVDLEVLGATPDGTAVILTDSEGTRYSLPITEELRIAVRRPLRDLASTSGISANKKIRPKEIQTLMRAGVSAAEIAANHDMEVESLERFESPILAERAYAAEQGRNARISREATAPTLGELVVNRLAARGIDPEHTTWDATRNPGEPWHVNVTFVQDATEHIATWKLNQAGRSVEAIDQEATWLTETTTPAGPQRGAIPLHPAPEPAETEEVEQVQGTEQLLDELNARRGQRVEPATGEDPEDEEDPDALPGMEHIESAPKPDRAEERPAKKKGRRAMPSWDEIVFGAKP